MAVRQTSNANFCVTMIGFLCSLVKIKRILMLKYTAISSSKLITLKLIVQVNISIQCRFASTQQYKHRQEKRKTATKIL